MNPAGRAKSKTAEARARRGIRKSADDAEVLDPDDPEFDAKLDASIERAYERIEAELDRMIEDLRSLPNRARPAKCVNPCVTHCVTKSCRRNTCAGACPCVTPARWQAVRIEQARPPAHIGTVDTNPHTNPHGTVSG